MRTRWISMGLLFLSVWHFSAKAEGLGPTLKQRQDCEVTVTKGIVALNAGHEAEATQMFQKALVQWTDCYYALEYLGVQAERKGDLEGALRFYLQAKQSSPDERWGFLNFHIGKTYLDLKNEERAELYLRVAVDQGAFSVQANYLLGYVLYRQQRYLEAEKYFHTAWVASQTKEAWEVDQLTAQALAFYLGEIYARLGFTDQAVRFLRRVERGNSIEMRQAAWRYHGFLNHRSTHLSFGVFYNYDSNVGVLSYGQILPPQLSKKEGHGVATLLDAGIATSPAQRLGAGLDGTALLKFYLTGNFQKFETLQLAPAGWIRYWNLKNLEGRLSYELVRTGLRRLAYEAYEWRHGPALTGRYLLNNRWVLSARYGLSFLNYPGDEAVARTSQDRSGYEHGFSVKAVVDSPNPWLRPWVGYDLTLNTPSVSGAQFQYTGHGLRLGSRVRLMQRLEGFLGLEGQWRVYSNYLGSREDREYWVRTGLEFLLRESWILALYGNYTRNKSSVPVFSAERFEFNTGVIFRL